ncbi:MAG: hypothetical protein WBF28_02835 [Atribacterota bacterium]
MMPVSPQKTPNAEADILVALMCCHFSLLFFGFILVIYHLLSSLILQQAAINLFKRKVSISFSEKLKVVSQGKNDWKKEKNIKSSISF